MTARRRLSAGLLVLLTAALGTGQLALPSLAEGRIRDSLSAFGDVRRVEVSAMPAVTLLAGRVDRAEVEMGRATVGGDDDAVVDVAEMFDRARGVGQLQATIEELVAGPLRALDVRVSKEGTGLRVGGRLSAEMLAAALPGAQLRVDSGVPVVQLTSLPLPLPGPVEIELVVDDGALVARPRGTAAMMLPAQPLLQDSRIEVTQLVAHADGDDVVIDGQARLR